MWRVFVPPHQAGAVRATLGRRLLATAAAPSTAPPARPGLGRGLLLVTVLGGGYAAHHVATRNAELGWAIAKPVLHSMDPEQAHRAAIIASSLGLSYKDTFADPPSLKTTVLGLEFSNPVGLAAGFDKDAECPSELVQMGFGFVEIGSVTPLPQPGNPKPRMFRLPEDRGVINRYGFNSSGVDAVKKNIKANWVPDKVHAGGRKGVLGVNLGKNKESTDAEWDYCKGVALLGGIEGVSYIVVNVSSPNTPGLRSLQGRQQLRTLLSAVKTERDRLPSVTGRPTPPLLVKIAPDLTSDDKKDIAAVVTELGIDGIVVSNTTISRPDTLQSGNKGENGGLSGAPVKALADKALFDMYTLTKGTVALIGVGGIATGEDAYRKIRLGASLIQVYSCLAYDGPPMIRRIKNELAALLERDGFASVADAVGADHREKAKAKKQSK